MPMTNLFILITMIVMGFYFGRIAERRHYSSLSSREKAFRELQVLTIRRPPPIYREYQSNLVSGSTVVSVDFFKVFVAGFKNIIGGRLTTYESLLERARREAILRMQQHALHLGATMIINARFETSRVAGNASQGIGSVEILVYGTALSPNNAEPPIPDK